MIHIRNTKNQLNYTIGRVKRYLNNPQESRYKEVLRDIFDCGLEWEMCVSCPYDDVGYCGLRDADISYYRLRSEYCFKAFLRMCEDCILDDN